MSFSFTEYDEDGTSRYVEFFETTIDYTVGTGALVPPDNTDGWGPVFFFSSPPPPRKWPLGLSWVREIESPWRRGVGVAIRIRNLHVIGLWFQGPSPMAFLSELPEPDMNILPTHLVADGLESHWRRASHSNP